MQFSSIFRTSLIGAACICSAVVLSSDAHAQVTYGPAPETVAALYVREKVLPPGQIVFDNRIAKARTATGVPPTHDSALSAQIATALHARAGHIEEVTRCKPSVVECHLNDARSVLWLSKAHVDGAAATVQVSILVDTPAGAKRPFAAYEYVVTLTQQANKSWVATKVQDALSR